MHPFGAASVATFFRLIHLEQHPESEELGLWNRSDDGGGVAHAGSESSRDRWAARAKCSISVRRLAKADRIRP
jgi:hypothetical protein